MAPKTTLKKSAALAASAPVNVISGAVSLAASAALWNPLPLILWGLGSAAWLVFASTSEKYLNAVRDEERAQKTAMAEAERRQLRTTVETALTRQPFVSWVRRGLMPDYAVQYAGLLDVRVRIGRVASERTEFDLASTGIEGQLDYMLGAFLQFVRARTTYLQILGSVRVPDLPSPPAPAHPASMGRLFRSVPPPPPPERIPDIELPRVEQRSKELDAKIEELKRLAEKEPATADTRSWHIGILQKQKDLLVECQKRDQVVFAQLQAIPDMFEVLLGRVSASQFDAREVVSYMGSIVEQVEETERFVESMRPAMDEMLGGLEALGAR